MADLLSIPENVMIQHIFPCLDHNDLLRLRRVSKQTKAFADAYFWTPQPGHQGKWELKIDSSKEDHSLQAFLQLGLPPPSRLYIANKAVMKPSERSSFFKDEHLEEFMERYSKYVTKLRLDKLFFPFTSAKELGFYESLINLRKLCCKEMITVGGTDQFERKTKRAEGSFLIRPTFKNLKIFKLDFTDCMDSMWNFINGISNDLDELFHPFFPSFHVLEWSDDPIYFNPVRELIERRGMRSQSRLVYDWRYMLHNNPMELLQVFASCRDNGVLIKNLDARLLYCILFDENGWFADTDEMLDPITREWRWGSLVKYQRNLFVGSVIHSLEGVVDPVFLMELPALEKISAFDAGPLLIRPRRGCRCPEWPNLKKMHVNLDDCSEAHYDFFWAQLRPKLEELCLTHGGHPKDAGWRIPRNLGNCWENLKRLTISNCAEDNNLFLSLWEGLPLLEDVTLIHCSKLTNKGFVGNGGRGSRPVFLKLEKLKHLSIQNVERMPRLTDAVFTDVFRHLKLSSFELSSEKAIRSITVAGLRELLTGQFAETIEKLKLDHLMLKYFSGRKLKEVVSRFRCSKML